MASDPASYYEAPSADANNLLTNDRFSIDLLLSRVEQFERQEKLEVLQKLTDDNLRLQQLVHYYQKHWCCTLVLLEKSQEAVKRIEKSFEHCVSESAAAERAWLGYWGIKKEHIKPSHANCSAVRWI